MAYNSSPAQIEGTLYITLIVPRHPITYETVTILSPQNKAGSITKNRGPAVHVLTIKISPIPMDDLPLHLLRTIPNIPLINISLHHMLR